MYLTIRTDDNPQTFDELLVAFNRERDAHTTTQKELARLDEELANVEAENRQWRAEDNHQEKKIEGLEKKIEELEKQVEELEKQKDNWEELANNRGVETAGQQILMNMQNSELVDIRTQLGAWNSTMDELTKRLETARLNEPPELKHKKPRKD
ncbi:hypothetical protein P280DRAFT_514822 [Massarina eburnea CBS 473.64]|uniref:Uncharacterized protein n=1 Tax=Massarina eburnea CBS 473.64 TaxID=1395130 RepID=A0A6A6SBN3_9PLEO|nr:hypothetical protein P280DRAFT_514822 [Massarina eburnea CBS 473.64]